jgi:hypothetical protein
LKWHLWWRLPLGLWQSRQRRQTTSRRVKPDVNWHPISDAERVEPTAPVFVTFGDGAFFTLNVGFPLRDVVRHLRWQEKYWLCKSRKASAKKS